MIVNLSLSGLMMMGKVPVFFINLSQFGPHTGILGAKVWCSVFCTPFHLCQWCQFYYRLSQKQAYMAYKSRLNIIAEVYWLKIKTIL